jgi:hypothetical protein
MVQACADNARPTAAPTVMYFSTFICYNWKEIPEYDSDKKIGNRLFDLSAAPKLNA